MATNLAFLNNVLQGLYVSAAFSFLVLLLVTKNIVLSIYSVAFISCIMVSMMAVT
jgi:hypothetical protein